MNWHTSQERRVIRKHGGKPLIKFGYDGRLRGKPCEVRSARRDKRYRIQKNVHENLVSKNGYYIFVKHGKSKVMKASKVSKKIGRGRWYRDRRYPHKFLKVSNVF